jgi:hypothetical protein
MISVNLGFPKARKGGKAAGWTKEKIQHGHTTKAFTVKTKTPAYGTMHS